MKSIAPFCALIVVVLAAPLFAAAPPAGPDRDRVATLIEKLDDDDFFVRQKADDQLRAMGTAVLPLLKTVRAATPSLEVKHRIDRMTEAMQRAELTPTAVQ